MTVDRARLARVRVVGQHDVCQKVLPETEGLWVLRRTVCCGCVDTQGGRALQGWRALLYGGMGVVTWVAEKLPWLGSCLQAMWLGCRAAREILYSGAIRQHTFVSCGFAAATADTVPHCCVQYTFSPKVSDQSTGARYMWKALHRACVRSDRHVT